MGGQVRATAIMLTRTPAASLTSTHLHRFEGAEPSSAAQVRSLREEVTMLPNRGGTMHRRN